MVPHDRSEGADESYSDGDSASDASSDGGADGAGDGDGDDEYASVERRVLVWDTQDARNRNSTQSSPAAVDLNDGMLHAIPLFMAPYDLVGPIGLSPENKVCFQCYIPALGSEADHGSYGVVAL